MDRDLSSASPRGAVIGQKTDTGDVRPPVTEEIREKQKIDSDERFRKLATLAEPNGSPARFSIPPSALALSSNGGHLYVANANSDTVSVIDTSTDKVTRTIAVSPVRKAPLGSSPNALAVTTDDKTLYVANASNNAIAVVDLSSKNPQPRGFIPTGWYPAAVTLSVDESQLLIASGYGFGSIAPQADPAGRSFADRKGVVSIVKIPDADKLAKFTEEVKANNAVLPATSKENPSPNNPIPMNHGRQSPIKHVFYVIKENRTYDQVFGDVPEGNGDASLAIFGRNVTPNHHALAEKY